MSFQSRQPIGRVSPEAAAERLLENAALFPATQKTELDLLVHAYQQAYKIEGTTRNVVPRTAVEREAMQQLDTSFRTHVFGLASDCASEVSGIFTHHPKVRSTMERTIYTFLAEIRDVSAHSFFPESGVLFRYGKGVVLTKVSMYEHNQAFFDVAPLYSADAFEYELDMIARNGIALRGSWILERAGDVLRSVVNDQGATLQDLRSWELISGHSGACLSGQFKGHDVIIGISRDPRTAGLQVTSHVR